MSGPLMESSQRDMTRDATHPPKIVHAEWMSVKDGLYKAGGSYKRMSEDMNVAQHYYFELKDTVGSKGRTFFEEACAFWNNDDPLVYVALSERLDRLAARLSGTVGCVPGRVFSVELIKLIRKMSPIVNPAAHASGLSLDDKPKVVEAMLTVAKHILASIPPPPPSPGVGASNSASNSASASASSPDDDFFPELLAKLKAIPLGLADRAVLAAAGVLSTPILKALPKRAVEEIAVKLSFGGKIGWELLHAQKEAPGATAPSLPVLSTFLASASDDQTIRIWDSKSGETTRVLTGHTVYSRSVCSLPDGLIAYASTDKTIRIWDSKTGETKRVLMGHTSGVIRVCSLPDGLIASASRDKTIRIWDSKSGETKRVLTGHTSAVYSICSLHDGLIASTSYDKDIRIWDSKSGETTRVLTGHTDEVNSVCSLPDGLIASCSADKTVRIWDCKSGETKRILTGHTRMVYSVCSLPDGLLASGSHDCTIRIWDSKSGETTRVLTGHTNVVSSVYSLPDGLIASASDDQTVRIWDSKSGETVRVLKGHTESVSCVCSLPE